MSALNMTLNISCKTVFPPGYSRPDKEEPINYIFCAYILPVLFVIGFTGNGLNVITLFSRPMRSKATMFLAAMAIADLLYLSSYFLFRLRFYEILRVSFAYYTYWIHAHVVFLGLVNWFRAASNWLIVAVTLERLIAVRFPLRAKIYLRSSRIVSSIIIIYAATLLLSLHWFICRRIQRHPVCNATADVNYTYRFDPIRRFPTYYRTAVFVHVVSMIFTPLVLITTFNIVLIVTLARRWKSQNELSQGKATVKNEDKITALVIVMICSYIIFNMPDGIASILGKLGAITISRSRPAGMIATMITDNLVTVGKTVNFFIYCTVSKQFRSRVFLLVLRSHAWERMVFSRSTRYRSVPTSNTVETTNGSFRKHASEPSGAMLNRKGLSSPALQKAPCDREQITRCQI